jgi:hypothetical protein
MNRQEVDELLGVRDFPCVSILAPTERRVPENRQNGIRLKNLIKRAHDLLDRDFPRRAILAVHERLDELARTLVSQPALDGIGLFVSRAVARREDFPFAVPERVVIDREFALREVVFALNRTVRYRVLVLGERPTRLLSGLSEHLVEVTNDDFPAEYERPGELVETPGGVIAPRGRDRRQPRPAGPLNNPHSGVEPGTEREEYRKRFLHSIDDCFARIADADPLPLAIVGVVRELGFFEEVSRHARWVIAKVAGAHDETPPHELARLVWPIVERKHREVSRARADRDLDSAIKSGKVVFGIEESGRAAREGRAAVAIVEEGYRFPAVDEVVDEVLRKGGEVVIVPDGTLPPRERLAVTLRYQDGAGLAA